MNDAIAAIAPGRRIDLAREADFVVDGVQVRPTACEGVVGGRRSRLQPRLMQVLIALARAGGQPVSREALAQVCWGQVTVGEDALYRCIQRLRRVAETEASGAFAIETIPRIGYRLVSTDRRPEAAPSDPRSLATTAAAETEPLLAVLAFDNLSGDPEMAWFSDGLSEEILQTVARGADLKVIGRTSSLQFRGADKVIARMAAELNATHVLDGSVRRDGTRVRIAAQLIECASQTTLWADSFERDLTDIFALQDDIAGAVAAALTTTFTHPSPIGKIDPVAFDLYLEARSPSHGPPLSAPEKIARLERVVSLAPQLGRAWSELAYLRAVEHRRNAPNDSRLATARAEIAAAAEKALALDPRSGLAYAALGRLLPWGDYKGRESWFKKALESTAQDARIVAQMGWLAATVGRSEDALSFASQALTLDPLYSGAASMYAHMLTSVGRYDESQRSYDLFREKWPLSQAFTSAPLNFAAYSGDWEGFERLHALAYELGVSGPHIAEALSVGEMIRDPTPQRRERVRQIIRAQISRTGTVAFGPLNMACRMGLADEVFSFVEQASFAHLMDETGPPAAAAYSPSIIFDRTSNYAMIEDIRFVGFCAKIGLCEYWIKTDRWPDCAAFVPYDFKAEARRLAAA